MANREQKQNEMTELTCGRPTARGKMTTGACAHVGPRTKTIPTRVPTDCWRGKNIHEKCLAKAF